MVFSVVKRVISLIAFCSVVFLTTNALALTLPLPDTKDIGGVPVTSSHDDFYTYSAALLIAMTGANRLPGYTFTAGDFGHDPKDIYFIANNVNVPNGGFPAPLNSPQGDPVPPGYWTGTWPAEGRVAVNDLLSYLQANTGGTVPVFMFNMNQQGNTANQTINVSGEVRIFDAASGGAPSHSWSLDDTYQAGDGAYDLLSWVEAPGELTVPYYGTLVANLGNAYDYLAYAPTLDLNAYKGKYLEFFIGLDGVNDGPEYVGISGVFKPSVVPEPASMLLFGMGLVGLAGVRRFRRK